MDTAYIVVHGGAGVHSLSGDRVVKHALKHACYVALQSLTKGYSAISTVEEAICTLEDEECLNAGYGSNLTMDGKVECDAAIMDGKTGDFGSVGAISGIKNPIEVAHSILKNSRAQDALGRIPPLTLVSEGAHEFARSGASQVVPEESMVSSRALHEWEDWKARLQDATHELCDMKCLNDTQDTVGAVVSDHSGDMAAGVSSGGLLLKYPGRVGEAAIFGAGCWAQQSITSEAKYGVACSVSGAGEHIIRSNFAQSIGDEFFHLNEDPDVHTILHQILTRKTHRIFQSEGGLQPNVGVILLTKFPDVRLWCGFTTASMAVAYASSNNPTPKAVILRRPESTIPRDGSPSIFITSLRF